MFDMIESGKKISHIRKKCEMTQSELAEEVGVSCQAVSSWERGVTMPDISNLKKIAEILNTSVDYILGSEEIAENMTVICSNKIPVDEDHTFSDFDMVKKVYDSGDLVIFCEFVESLTPDVLSKIFEIAYKDANIAFVSEMVDFVSQDDIKNCALYAYNKQNISMFAEITDNLSTENKSLLTKMAILDKRIDYLTELMA